MLERLRQKLASGNALMLAFIGFICGLMVGAVILVFRLLIEGAQGLFLPDASGESYESLSAYWRFLLPVTGGLLIGAVFHFFSAEQRRVGIVHVLERVGYHQAYLPLRNAVLQFFGAAASIISGHSVGREGPGVHLGAASGSLLGQWFSLPNNSLRTLVACGAAASIAASFNTPLAGVVFAMEVIMLEYSIAGFVPVILASVSATWVTRSVYGAAPAFTVPAVEIGSLLELPWIILTGVLIGLLAALFTRSLTEISSRTLQIPFWIRCTLGGVAVGVIALFMPQVMGIGYDTVNQAFLGELGLGLLAALVLAKLLASVIGIGLGLPGGLIAPTLFIGAVIGSLLGLLGIDMMPGQNASPGMYAMIGMGAMMAAVLNAPLAALLAIVELTANPNIILPGMLCVIAANLTASYGCKQPSVFVAMLRARGLDYLHDPFSQALRGLGVTAIMDKRFVHHDRMLPRSAVEHLLANDPNWVVIAGEEKEGPVALLPSLDLRRYLEAENEVEETDDIDLLAIPAQRLQPVGVPQRANLQEALGALDEHSAEAVYVWRRRGRSAEILEGILTREAILSARHRST